MLATSSPAEEALAPVPANIMISMVVFVVMMMTLMIVMIMMARSLSTCGHLSCASLTESWSGLQPAQSRRLRILTYDEDNIDKNVSDDGENVDTILAQS